MRRRVVNLNRKCVLFLERFFQKLKNRVFLDRNSAAGLGTLFASIVCVTTLISLLFYVGVACKSGLKNLREAKKLRNERREARKYRKMTAYDVHAGYALGGGAV